MSHTDDYILFLILILNIWAVRGGKLGRSHNFDPPDISFRVNYLLIQILGRDMGEMKTIISANIPVSLASKLKNKTKGTRSRVITRALSAYLADMDAFDISDIETTSLLIELFHRKDITQLHKDILRQIYLELNA